MTPASLDELLKEWEKEAQERLSGPTFVLTKQANERLLAVITVVRKQREALEGIAEPHLPIQIVLPEYRHAAATAREALAEAERILKG